MSYKLTDTYINRRINNKLDHRGGVIDGNTNIINGDLYVNGGLIVPVGSVVQYINETPPRGW